MGRAILGKAVTRDVVSGRMSAAWMRRAVLIVVIAAWSLSPLRSPATAQIQVGPVSHDHRLTAAGVRQSHAEGGPTSAVAGSDGEKAGASMRPVSTPGGAPAGRTRRQLGPMPAAVAPAVLA